jgi:hypothetical protein
MSRDKNCSKHLSKTLAGSIAVSEFLHVCVCGNIVDVNVPLPVRVKSQGSQRLVRNMPQLKRALATGPALVKNLQTAGGYQPRLTTIT